LKVEFVDMADPLTGFSTAMVLRSGTMMRFARSLRTVGELYYSCKKEIEAINRARDELWRRDGGEVSYEELSSPEIRALEEALYRSSRVPCRRS
jgi:hypothetical protein